MKIEFYSLKSILEKCCQYNIIFGERSNGKTYSVLEYGLKNYVATSEKMAIIRRWEEDFKGKRGSEMFSSFSQNGMVSKITKNQWSEIYYYSGRWYLAKREEKTGKIITDEKPFAYAFSLTRSEHDKSSSFSDITTILFDEFLTRGMYLPDEFVVFMNVISTIIRYRDNVKIFMLGNTVNKYCPYFAEMGLKHLTEMKKGDIDVYTYGDTNLRVAVEYADSPNKSKPSDLYFAFDNPKLNMITGGAWELAIYPHCPFKYKPKEIVFIYFIQFMDEILQCEIISHENSLITFIHKKTSEIKNTDTDFIYTCDYNPKHNYHRKITKPTSDIEKRICEFFVKDKVFYQDNETGEIVRNYLQWCKTVQND